MDRKDGKATGLMFAGMKSGDLDGRRVRVGFTGGTVIEGTMHVEVGAGFIDAGPLQNVSVLDRERGGWAPWNGVETVEFI